MRGAALLAVGLLAALAMGKRKPSTTQSTTGNGNGTTGGPGGGTQGGGSTTGLPLSLPGTPRDGTFYQATEADLEHGDDPLESLASTMLYGQPLARDANVETLANCLANSDWNRHFYGDDVAMAFERQNPNALNALKNGNWPMLVTADGPTVPPSQRVSYGVLWLPRIVRAGGNIAFAAGGADTPAPISCADLNPPQALLNSLDGVTPDWAKQKGPQA